MSPVPTIDVWHSYEGGPWQLIEIRATVLAAGALAELPPSGIYEDAYGNRYALEPPEGEPRE